MFFRSFARKSLMLRAFVPTALGLSAMSTTGFVAKSVSDPKQQWKFDEGNLNKKILDIFHFSKHKKVEGQETEDALRYIFVLNEYDPASAEIFIEAYIAKYGSVNAKLLLHLAAGYNCFKIVKTLVEKYQIDVSSDQYLIPTVIAAPSKKMLCYLLDLGAKYDESEISQCIIRSVLFPHKKEVFNRKERSAIIEYLLTTNNALRQTPKSVIEELFYARNYNYADVVFSNLNTVVKLLPCLDQFEDHSNWGVLCGLVHMIGSNASPQCRLSVKAVSNFFKKLDELKYPFKNLDDYYALINAGYNGDDEIVKILIKYILPHFKDEFATLVHHSDFEYQKVYRRIKRLDDTNTLENSPSSQCRM